MEQAGPGCFRGTFVYGKDDATIIAINLQEKAGLDIITDGEEKKKLYISNINMNGFDYEKLKPKG